MTPCCRPEEIEPFDIKFPAKVFQPVELLSRNQIRGCHRFKDTCDCPSVSTLVEKDLGIDGFSRDSIADAAPADCQVSAFFATTAPAGGLPDEECRTRHVPSERALSGFHAGAGSLLVAKLPLFLTRQPETSFLLTGPKGPMQFVRRIAPTSTPKHSTHPEPNRRPEQGRCRWPERPGHRPGPLLRPNDP